MQEVLKNQKNGNSPSKTQTAERNNTENSDYRAVIVDVQNLVFGQGQE